MSGRPFRQLQRSGIFVTTGPILHSSPVRRRHILGVTPVMLHLTELKNGYWRPCYHYAAPTVLKTRRIMPGQTLQFLTIVDWLSAIPPPRTASRAFAHLPRLGCRRFHPKMFGRVFENPIEPPKYQKFRLAPARLIGRLDFAFATAGSGGFLHFDRNPNY